MAYTRSIAGLILGALRAARGVTQSTIAEECGRSPSYISNWENGDIDIPNRLIGVYAKHSDVPEQEIWDLIDLWQKEYDEYFRREGNSLFYESFKRTLFGQLRHRYYREPLNPRTRRDLGRKI